MLYLLYYPFWVGIMEKDERVSLAVQTGCTGHHNWMDGIRTQRVVANGERIIGTARVGSESCEDNVS